jgi:hypothetical protein
MRRPSAPAVATFVAVVAVVVVTLWALDPALLLAQTTTTGGDTGAHVALAAFLKNALLPHLHVTGWDPGAYDGYPLYTFYFPLPDLLAAVLGYVMPFTIAFKIATVLGSLTLPVAAWAFGRLAGLERPRPAVLALATLPFLFDQSFTIYGGNLFSTMAGEYAFSLGLSAALVFLGLVVRGLRTNRQRAAAALLLAFCVLCHLVAALVALAGVVVALLLVGVTRRRLWWAVTVVGTGLLLTAWWAVPFALEQPFSTNMGWVNVTTYAALLAPPADRWALVVAALGCVVALVRRDRVAGLLAILGAAAAGALVLDPQGKLYNTRFLPLWWLCAYLLAGYFVAEAGVWLVSRWRRLQDALALVPGPVVVEGGTLLAGRQRGELGGEAGALEVGERPPGTAAGGPVEETPTRWAGLRPRRGAPGAVSVPIAAMALTALVVLPPLIVPPGATFDLGPVIVTHNNVPGWAKWNYSGYERAAGWHELHDGVVATMDRVSRRYGCGRAMWEYNSNLDRFGTPMAPMLLPYFTGGCIDSMEGLLFESASSTPYHFLNQSELSAAPSDAMVGLQYAQPNVALGVQHLQLLGVRYYLASSPSLQGQADADPALELVATTGPWHAGYNGGSLSTTWKVYLVRHSAMVAPLTEQPTVLVGTGPQQSSWLPVAQRWYLDPSQWEHELVAGGPTSWPRQRAAAAMASSGTPLASVQVSDIRSTAETLSFHVSRTGVPVLVRISYFPAWHAVGAEGPWRAEPNLMVVVPTSRDVTLHYGRTAAGWLGLGLSLVGLVITGALLRRRSHVLP